MCVREYAHTNTRVHGSSPRSPECQAVELAGQAHSGCVHDGHELLDVRREHPVEELLVAILERHQKHVSRGAEHDDRDGEHTSMLISNIPAKQRPEGLSKTDVCMCVTLKGCYSIVGLLDQKFCCNIEGLLDHKRVRW